MINSYTYEEVNVFTKGNMKKGFKAMTLKELKPGQSGVVDSVKGAGNIRRRVLEMGVTPGVKIDVIKVAPLGDPVEVMLRGYNLSLRKEEAEAITLK